MSPRILRIDPDDFDPARLAPAVEALRSGGFVVFPTETVYGVGIAASGADAAARLNALKGRAPDHPLSVHLAPAAETTPLAGQLRPLALRLLRRFTPGPLTLIIPAAGGGDVGLRVPAHAVCSALLRAAGGAILGTSANATGEPAPTCVEQIPAALLESAAAVVDAGPCRFAQASTVVRARGDRPEILREGAIPAPLILDEAGPVTLLVCTGNTCRSPMAAAILRRRIAERFEGLRAERGLPLPAVRSAGVAARGDDRASAGALHVAADRGLDLASHRARRLDAESIRSADFILTMSPGAAAHVHALAPNALGELVVLNAEEGGIPDPFGGSVAHYAACAASLDRALDTFLAHEESRFVGPEA